LLLVGVGDGEGLAVAVGAADGATAFAPLLANP
jgi:hypothetical protein